jgi:hypothetical protein
MSSKGKKSRLAEQSFLFYFSCYWVLTNAILFVSIELLSLVRALTPVNITVIMLGNFAAVAVVIKLVEKSKKTVFPQPSAANISIGTLIAASLVSGIFVAPNNWDSMTYHLPRVLNWFENRGIQHFVSLVERQNYISPFGDYQSLGFMAFGSDRWAFMPSFISSLLLVALFAKVCKSLGVSQAVTNIGIFLLLSPNFVSQINTTQVDIRAAAFAAIGLYLLTIDKRISVYLGILAFGLAVGTKFISVIPFAAMLFIKPIRIEIFTNLRKYVSALIVSLLIAISINLPWLTRNLETYGNVTGEAAHVLTGKLEINSILIDTTRYFSSNILYYPFESFNLTVKEITEKFLKFVFPDAVDTTPYGLSINMVASIPTEDDVSSSILLTFFLILTVLFIVQKRFWFAFIINLPMILTILVLAWQPWINRLLLSAFFVGLLIATYYLEQIRKPRLLKFLSILSLLAMLTSSFYVLDNERRSLIELFKNPAQRSSDYFVYRKSLESDFLTVTEALSSMKVSDSLVIGIEDSWEYPLMVLNPNVRFYADDSKLSNYIVCLDACTDIDYPNFVVVKTTTKGLKILARN